MGRRARSGHFPLDPMGFSNLAVMGDQSKQPPLQSAIAVGLAIGAGVGTALFAGADNPVWIGVGAGVGMAVGAAIGSRRRNGDASG